MCPRVLNPEVYIIIIIVIIDFPAHTVPYWTNLFSRVLCQYFNTFIRGSVCYETWKQLLLSLTGQTILIFIMFCYVLFIKHRLCQHVSDTFFKRLRKFYKCS